MVHLYRSFAALMEEVFAAMMDGFAFGFLGPRMKDLAYIKLCFLSKLQESRERN